MFSGPNDMPQVEIVAARLHPRVHSVHKSSEIWRCTSLGVMAYRSLRCRCVGVNRPGYFCIYFKIYCLLKY